MENGAKLDKEWRPCTYKEAMEKITEERAEVECFRKRYLELLRMLGEKEPKSNVQVLDQLEGIERELYRLGQREWIEKASKRYTI